MVSDEVLFAMAGELETTDEELHARCDALWEDLRETIIETQTILETGPTFEEGRRERERVNVIEIEALV